MRAAYPGSGELQPEQLREPYDRAVADGSLVYQRCNACRNAWLPPSWECPSCLGTDWGYEPASGEGTVVSWVVYHKAYHPEFADRLPYNVAIVELAEGPRLITNVVGPDILSRLRVGLPVRLVVEDEQGAPIARFGPAQ